jgi:heme/copper-type cytochrome/quinol oxidase subunit 2
LDLCPENEEFVVTGGSKMPVVVVVHRLKNFDEWLKVFKADPPPKIGRWRLLRL